MKLNEGDEVVFVQADGSEPIEGKTEHQAFVSKVNEKNVLDLTVYFHAGFPEVVKKIPAEKNKVDGKGFWKQKQ